jgi:hypothetical protein
MTEPSVPMETPPSCGVSSSTAKEPETRPLESWLANQLYRQEADPSSPRPTSSAVARSVIPITHDRILREQQPAATPRLVANQQPDAIQQQQHGV